MIFKFKTLPEFWERYNALPEALRERADKQFELLAKNPRHPSLQLKPVGDLWSARVTDGYRALAVREHDVLTWFWIGSHDEYERIVNG